MSDDARSGWTSILGGAFLGKEGPAYDEDVSVERERISIFWVAD